MIIISREICHENLNTNLIDYIQGGVVVTGTNSNAHPRLNSFELSSVLKINESTKLYNVNLKCSNLINSLSINNICKPLLKQNTIILKNG